MRRILFNWWTLTGLAAAILAVVLAFGLPLLAPPLRPWWVRLLLVLAVGAAWAAAAAVHVLRARRASAALAKELAAPSATDREGELLAQRMREALARLKTASGDRRDYLYSRPWYVIIGPPGAGKTTALIKSGIHFPYADTALKGVGGTRNLDFWFADEAVLVDTAGRYTTQDSETEVDAHGWERFLRLLRRTRPLQPVNGVLVAIGLDELMRADRVQLDAHAAAVRRRLAELRRVTEVSPPVYLLFTKADLLAGFGEFFEDLNVEGRRAVLGATLPLEPQQGIERLLAEFDAVVESLSARVSKRLQEEADPRRRSLILGLPAQLASLRARFARFAEGAFLSDAEARPLLRGFYLTSGVQEGATLDRVLGEMAAVYDLPQGGAAADGAGRAYFLNRLLKEVVFAEAGLVQTEPKARARRRRLQLAGFAGVGVAGVLMLALWSASFAQNKALQGQLLAGAQNTGQEIHAAGIDLVEVREGDPDLEQSLAVLRSLRELPRGYADQAKGGAPLLMRLGLYQGGHANAAEQAYLEALQRILLPRVLLRLERYLQDHANEPMALYEPLKAYLMLGGHGPLDAKAVKAWVVADWETRSLAGDDRAQVRAELEQHLDALLADPQFGRVWPARQAPLDGALIETARASVQSLSLAERAYALLRQKAAATGELGWRAEAVLSSADRQAFQNGEAVMQLAVPYFFTREGYQRAYQIGLQTVQSELERDLWVLGPDAEKTAIRSQVQTIRPGVAALYAREYVQAWDGVLTALQPADYFADPAALGAFTRNPSPLKVVLLEVRKHTSFGGTPKPAAIKDVGDKLAKAGLTNGGGIDAGRTIQAHFRPIADYVGTGEAPAPVDEFVSALRQAAAANTAAGVAGGGLGGDAVQGQLATALGAVTTSAALAPPQLQGFVAAAAQSGRGAAAASAHNAIGERYASALHPICRGAVENRYPFYGAARNDAAAGDLLRVFGMNGEFDSFVRANLASLVDTTGPVWRWRSDHPTAAALDPGSAEQFQKAAEVRELIAAGLPLKIELAGLGGAVTAVEFAAGGITHRFDGVSAGARPVMWTLNGHPAAEVVLYAGKDEVRRFEAQGLWALFRLLDSAQKENAGPTAIKATFGQGAQFATFKVALPSEKNPFGRGGLWSFRCPAKL